MADIKDLMSSRIRSGRLFHAYIISGGSTEKRLAAANFIAKAALCENIAKAPCGACRHCVKMEKGIHPDVTMVMREKDVRDVTVDVIRNVRSDAMVMPNEADKSVYILPEADLMNTPAQNAFLKILEEPPVHGVFILLADNPELLLPTVRSRCETILLPPEEDDGEVSPEAAAIMDAFLKGTGTELLRACAALEKMEKSEVLAAVLDLRRMVTEKAARGQVSMPAFQRLSEAFDKCEKYMGANLNTGYISGLLLAELTGARSF